MSFEGSRPGEVGEGRPVVDLPLIMRHGRTKYTSKNNILRPSVFYKIILTLNRVKY